jgi:hypothetical protein
MATALRDPRHDHHVLVDLMGAVVGVAAAVLLVLACLAGVGFVLFQWIQGVGS